jgi:hypothetical protein
MFRELQNVTAAQFFYMLRINFDVVNTEGAEKGFKYSKCGNHDHQTFQVLLPISLHDKSGCVVAAFPHLPQC